MAAALAEGAIPAVLEAHEIGERVVRRGVPDFAVFHQAGGRGRGFRCARWQRGQQQGKSQAIVHAAGSNGLPGEFQLSAS